ncbi:MAG: helix-turn-helix domain-containing protein [Patescibacteria group bacterium]
MSINDRLGQIGLNQSETKAYLFLLEHGLSSPTAIAKGVGIQRPNAYQVIHSLLQRGLILEQKQGGRRAYLTGDPEALLIGLEQKKALIDSLLPDLRGLRNLQKNKPTVQYFDGLSQIQDIYLMALESDELLALGSTDRLYQIMPSFVEGWLSKLKKKGIVLHDIVTHVSSSEAAHKMIASLKGYYDAKVLPKTSGELTTDILIWDNHLALITLEEPYFGTVITNSSLVNTFRQILSILRSALDKVETSVQT